MERFDSEIEHLVFERFRDAFAKTDLRVASQDKWQTSLLIRYFDIVIYKDVYPLAVIEVKTSFQNKNILARVSDRVRSAISITNSRFGIITDGEQYYLYDRSNKDLDFRPTFFDAIVSKLKNPDRIKISKRDKELISKIIVDAANKHLRDNQQFHLFIRNKSFLNRIQFDQNTRSYFFSDNDGGITSFENQFFIKIFGEFNEAKICRYTTTRAIFEMINNLSFRMNGLVGMNDRSEVNYVEAYLNGDNDVAKPIIKEPPDTISELNDRYITSCTMFQRKDDLTLWRLYSEDAKGVCLVFNVKQNSLNKFTLLQKVKYADENGKHKELDFLKQIKEDVERMTAFKFEFRKLGYWKHFFKSKDYAIEEEVRLLIIDNPSLPKVRRDWVMTYTHSIINPIIDFGLNSKAFPIRLMQILLGPKSLEQETNCVQLKEMIKRKKKEISEKSLDCNLRGLTVLLSNIKHYR